MTARARAWASYAGSFRWRKLASTVRRPAPGRKASRSAPKISQGSVARSSAGSRAPARSRTAAATAGEDPQGDARRRGRIGVVAEGRVLPLEEDQQEPARPEVKHEIARPRGHPARERSPGQRQAVQDGLDRLHVAPRSDGAGSRGRTRGRARSIPSPGPARWKTLLPNCSRKMSGWRRIRGSQSEKTTRTIEREQDRVPQSRAEVDRPREQRQADLRRRDDAEGMGQQAQAGRGARRGSRRSGRGARR